MSAESLHKIFKTLADPTRLRILALLAREELAVHELMEILAMAQSRVSRHLGILREAGLVRDRREGTFVFYRMAAPDAEAWQGAWELVREALRGDPVAEGDVATLERVLASRGAGSREFFDAVGPEWDALRKVLGDDLLRARALTRLVPADLRVADIGTGTGILAAELARLGIRVVAVDQSPRMLDAARAKLDSEGVRGVELRRGEASALPLGDDEVDAAFAHMVLHYLPSPADAVREMARITRPDGHVVVVDFVGHDREWMREELGVLWLGFASEEIEAAFTGASLVDFRWDAQPPVSRGADLPATFIASGRVAGAAR